MNKNCKYILTLGVFFTYSLTKSLVKFEANVSLAKSSSSSLIADRVDAGYMWLEFTCWSAQQCQYRVNQSISPTVLPSANNCHKSVQGAFLSIPQQAAGNHKLTWLQCAGFKETNRVSSIIFT